MKRDFDIINSNNNMVRCNYVVIGGGIAGVSCALELQRLLYYNPCITLQYNNNNINRKDIIHNILLITSTPHVVEVSNCKFIIIN